MELNEAATGMGSASPALDGIARANRKPQLGRIVRALPAILLALVVGFAFAAPIVGLAMGFISFYTTNPECHCYYEKIYQARDKFLAWIPILKVATLVLGMALSYLLWKVLRTREGFVSFVLGCMAGVCVWFGYEWFVNPSLQKAAIHPLEMGSIAGTLHGLPYLYYLDDLLKWKFVCAFVAFLVINISSGLIARSITSAAAQE
jgi:hypothetical protein